MRMLTDGKESKQGLVEYVVRLAGYLPALLEFIGTPRPVARAVRHGVRLVPAVRNATDAYDGTGDPVNGRFISILATQQQLDDRCNILEHENRKIKVELAGMTSQVQLLKAETLALRVEMDSLQKRNLYLGVGVLAAFLVALAELAFRLVK